MPEELLEAMNDYREVFGDSFPTIPLAVYSPPDEAIAIIRECLEKKKDVYELGYVTSDSSIMY